MKEKSSFKELNSNELMEVTGGGVNLIYAGVSKEPVITATIVKRRPVYELPVVRPVKA